MLTSLWAEEGRSEPSSWKRNHLGRRGRNQGQQSTQAHTWRPSGSAYGIWMGAFRILSPDPSEPSLMLFPCWEYTS